MEYQKDFCYVPIFYLFVGINRADHHFFNTTNQRQLPITTFANQIL